ncbi:MAG TPA: tetratricopeptide repeat protein, partial [Blastocatellia bacterium]|nr:tetratricopeptide repeat protein [Blastocatellia bacterium]
MKTSLWALLLIVGLGASVPLQRWMDARRDQIPAEESLYFTSGETLKRASFGFEGLLADLYWLRTIQYFGDKAQQVKGTVNIGNVKDWNLVLLESLLRITTELDPHYVAAYRFGALFLPDINPEGAIKFVQNGINNNPDDWRLYQDLGYIYWKQGRYREASETYERGSRIAKAPGWMKTMAAVMLAQGGERETARTMFQRIYESSDDPNVKGISLSRLQSMQSEDEIEFLNRLVITFREKRGECPSSLAGFMKSLPQVSLEKFQAAGLRLSENYVPLDPHGFTYDYDAASCSVTLSKESTI